MTHFENLSFCSEVTFNVLHDCVICIIAAYADDAPPFYKYDRASGLLNARNLGRRKLLISVLRKHIMFYIIFQITIVILMQGEILLRWKSIF